MHDPRLQGFTWSWGDLPGCLQSRGCWRCPEFPPPGRVSRTGCVTSVHRPHGLCPGWPLLAGCGGLLPQEAQDGWGGEAAGVLGHRSAPSSAACSARPPPPGSARHPAPDSSHPGTPRPQLDLPFLLQAPNPSHLLCNASQFPRQPRLPQLWEPSMPRVTFVPAPLVALAPIQPPHGQGPRGLGMDLTLSSAPHGAWAGEGAQHW